MLAPTPMLQPPPRADMQLQGAADVEEKRDPETLGPDDARLSTPAGLLRVEGESPGGLEDNIDDSDASFLGKTLNPNTKP